MDDAGGATSTGGMSSMGSGGDAGGGAMGLGGSENKGTGEPETRGEKIQEALKSAVPRYFLASWSFAQFRVPDMPPSQEDPVTGMQWDKQTYNLIHLYCSRV